jgi:hypothetical protein
MLMHKTVLNNNEIDFLDLCDKAHNGMHNGILP